ncbi:MAG: radical SAM protein [Patescibacteria group bacterium]
MYLKQIQLIQAPNSYGETRSSGCYPPLGLLSIATYFFRQLGVKAEILDGEIMSYEEISSRLNADVVGFTVNLLNAQNSAALSKIAKGKGAKVVWGGPHATVRWRQILNKQDSVDFVVRGDGERAFLNIVQNNIQDSPNVAHRNKTNVSIVETPLDLYPLPDYSLLPKTETYISNFEKQAKGVRILSVYSHRGCAFRLQHGPCVFCSIADKKLRFRNPDQFVAEVLDLQQKYGVTHLRDCGDSITGSQTWIGEVAGQLKNKSGPKFYIYARADEITEQTTKLLKDMGVDLVYLGGESGDDYILQAIRKHETRDQILRATELLSSQDIKVRVSFIAGLPGESHESISNTKKLIESLLQLPNVVYVPYSIILPLPGSKIFRMMEKRFSELKKEDVFDLYQLQELWVNNFCSISLDELREEYQQIKLFNGSKFDKGMGEKP